ncbi:MAG: lyase [Acidimicrobiia bacterium]
MRIRFAVIALLVSACTGTVLEPTTTQPVLDNTTTIQAGNTTTTPVTTTTIGSTTTTLGPEALTIVVFPVPAGSQPHDVAPATDGGVWYTAQGSGELGYLDPETGETRHIPLGSGSAPHGVIVDAEGTPWITDSGLNSIVSVDPITEVVTIYPLPDPAGDVNLNTASFGNDGRLWFTGQEGVYGVLDPAIGEAEIFDAPRGRGPYGITTTPNGDVYYASLAGSYLGAIKADGSAEVLDPPTENQGARRAWSDSTGAIWVSEWNSGNVSRFQPDTGRWDSWALPGDDPAAYAVFVDDEDIVWVSDFGSNSMVRFDPVTETFNVYPLPANPGNVRQILGRPDEVWGAQSAADSLILIRTG